MAFYRNYKEYEVSERNQEIVSDYIVGFQDIGKGLSEIIDILQSTLDEYLLHCGFKSLDAIYRFWRAHEVIHPISRLSYGQCITTKQ